RRFLVEREAGAGVFKDVAELVRSQAKVDRNGHAAELLEGPVGDDVLKAIAQDEQHAVAARDAEAREALGHRGCASVELGIGEPPTAVDDGLGVRSAERGAREEGRERHDTRRTFPLFFRSSTCWTAARASFRANARSTTGRSCPRTTWSRTVRSSTIDPRLVPKILRFFE